MAIVLHSKRKPQLNASVGALQIKISEIPDFLRFLFAFRAQTRYIRINVGIERKSSWKIGLIVGNQPVILDTLQVSALEAMGSPRGLLAQSSAISRVGRGCCDGCGSGECGGTGAGHQTGFSRSAFATDFVCV